MSTVTLCFAWTVLCTTVLGVSVSAVYGVTLGYDRRRREAAEKDRSHLITRVGKAHTNAAQWAPLLCMSMLAHVQKSTSPPSDVQLATLVATLGFSLHKAGLVWCWEFKHWFAFGMPALGFVLQTLGLLWVTARLVV